MDGSIRLTGPAPGFEKDPGHFVEVEPTPRRVRVEYQGEMLADSLNVLVMREANHIPVYYFPREDVRMDLMEPTDNTTH